MRIIIIGGVAAGAKAAAKSKRLLPDADVHIYTKDTFVSYSSCGLPYYVAGDFEDWHKLIVRTKEEFEKSGINIHTEHQVTKILPADKKILVKDLKLGVCNFVEYDKLIIATGAAPFIPDIKNTGLKNIFTLRTLEDGINMRSAMEKSQNITIIGGGYISIELIEAFVKNKKNVTLVERSPFILSVFDEDISSLIQSFILENSDGLVKILNEDQVCEFVGDETVTGVLTTNGSGFETDMAVIATGVYPVVDIAKEAGIEKGDVIVAVNGAKVKSANALQEQISKYRPGDKVQVTVDRNGSTKTFNVELRNAQGSTAVVKSAVDSGEVLGAAFSALTNEQKRELGVSYGIEVTGLLNGKLKDAGIKKGFIIMVVNDQKISSPEQLEKIVDKVLKGSENDRYIVVKGFYPNGRTKVYAIDLAE